MPLRVAFAGTPPFAASALAALHAAGHHVQCVLTQPDRPAGRGLQLQASPVKRWAVERGLPLAQPQGLKLDGRHGADAQAARATLQAAAPDVLVVAAYGLILPAWVLELPRLGCHNIHASLLPRWRGAAPVQRAIEAGDSETGITIMQMDAGLDTGQILRTAAVPIYEEDSAATLLERLTACGAEEIVQALREAEAGVLRGRPQPAEGATYAHKLSKAEAAIDWLRPAAEIERCVRAFDPQPGCHFELAGETVKLWRAAVVAEATPWPDGRQPTAGTLWQHGARWFAQCGDGQALELIVVQRPGGRRMPVSALADPRPVHRTG